MDAIIKSQFTYQKDDKGLILYLDNQAIETGITTTEELRQIISEWIPDKEWYLAAHKGLGHIMLKTL